MQTVKAWLGAARLRTLPLSVSGIIVGASLGNGAIKEATSSSLFHGYSLHVWQSPIFWLAILTTIGFQVLSNFANDYGDGVKGTDANREGEQRMVASGLITPKQMKKGMYIAGALSLLIASMLIFAAFGNSNMILAFVFFNLAIASVIAAIRYTVGKKAYGYSGFGDTFVFVFFGIVAVMGSYFLFTKSLSWDLLLPALSIGVFSVAVLNLNNMRDIVNDAQVGKNTMVVKLGIEKAKEYHFFLLTLGMGASIIYSLVHYKGPIQFLFVITFLPFLFNMKTVMNNKEPKLLDKELKKVAISTFAFAIAFSILNLL